MSSKWFEDEVPAPAASGQAGTMHAGLRRSVRLLLLEDQALDAELCERELNRGRSCYLSLARRAAARPCRGIPYIPCPRH